MSCAKFIVSGKVQRVYYRKHITNAMRENGFVGYVKNLNNGDVEVVVKNEPGMNIADILKILNEGSPKSEVEAITMGECSDEIVFSKIFEVRY